MKIQVSKIRKDGGTQARSSMNPENVQEYAEAMKEGAVFPPVVVFNDGESFWLGDGFHRVSAAEMAGIDLLEADVKEGDLRDARLYAIGANASHGIRRTNADKRMAVKMLLQDQEWCQWSNREIARRCGVSDPFVMKVREELSPVKVLTVSSSSHSDASIVPVESKKDAPEKPSDPPCVETETGAPAIEPQAHPAKAEHVSDPDELARLKAENEELKERLAEIAEVLADTQAELEAARRALDAEDLLGQFDKEIKRAQAQASVVQSRNNGLMNENADLKGRLKSALRKIEKLEKAARLGEAA